MNATNAKSKKSNLKVQASYQVPCPAETMHNQIHCRLIPRPRAQMLQKRESLTGIYCSGQTNAVGPGSTSANPRGRNRVQGRFSRRTEYNYTKYRECKQWQAAQVTPSLGRYKSRSRKCPAGRVQRRQRFGLAGISIQQKTIFSLVHFLFLKHFMKIYRYPHLHTFYNTKAERTQNQTTHTLVIPREHFVDYRPS